MERWTLDGAFTLAPGSATLWLLPVDGRAVIDGQPAEIGDAIIVEGAASIEIEAGSLIYVAYPGSRVITDILTPMPPSALQRRRVGAA